MGTEKRQRQKANRAQRHQEQQKADSRRRSFRIAALIIGGLVVVFGLVWIATIVAGDDEAATDTIAAVPSDLLDPVSTEPAFIDPPADTQPATDDSVTGATTTGPADTAPEGCPPDDGVAEPVTSFDAPPPTCLVPGATYQAVVATNVGEFTIDLDAEAAPETVNNFVFLARNGYYDDTPCHRIITDFVVQCGDPTGTGTGGPGYEFADELPAAGEYQLGSLAMANSGPDTNGSQFFIITGDQGVALPPQYSLFGDVSDGLDTTVEEMAAAGSAGGEPTTPVDIVSVRIVQS